MELAVRIAAASLCHRRHFDLGGSLGSRFAHSSCDQSQIRPQRIVLFLTLPRAGGDLARHAGAGTLRTFEPLAVTAVLSLISVGGLLAYFRSPITPYAEPLSPTRSANSVATLSWLGGIVLTAVTPFVVAQMLGAMSPQNDFDAVEYHLGGPKEWFQQGQISRLPHNVYTSFPCLVEMLILTGMVICGDWQWGSLAGQAVIAGFAPLTAVGLFAAGRRVFSNEAGWLAVLIYLTSPWTYRISIIAGVENGLACYLFAAFFAWLVLQDHLWQEDPLRHPAPFRLLFMTGLLAGCAMACKYTGLVSVVVPIAVLVIWSFRSLVVERRLRQLTLVLVILIAGVSATVGPWLIKNAVETGNPVYPLAVRVFGGTDRNAELDEKWRKGHAAKQYDRVIDRVVDLPIKLTDVMANNDWHSPLMFAFAPLSLFWFRRLRYGPELIDRDHACRHAMVSAAWLYVAWQFLTWWLLTHHIDRFYVPMFSVVGVLSGAGACWTAAFAIKSINDRGARIWNIVAAGLIIAAIIYNAEIMLLVGGFNGGRLDLMTARQIATPPRIHWLNEEFEAGRLPSNMKVLCVGEAQMFHARYRYV